MSAVRQKIAITGATGFLGSHLLSQAAQSGAELTCLVRKPVKRQIPAARIIAGDCLNSHDLEALLSGQDIFIHMAALLFGSDWQDYFRANLKAAQLIAKVLTELKPENRPKKMIFISSLAAAGPCGVSPGKNESEAAAPVSAYGWSKFCCEQVFAACPVNELIILRPPIIYGSGDSGLLPLFKSAAKGLGVSPGAFRKFPVSVIHADDAARAIMLACEKNLHGVFHLSDGKQYTMEEFCRAAANACGRSSCFVAHPPLPLMALTASISDALYGVLGGLARLRNQKKPAPPHWNRDKYDEAKQEGWLADGSKFADAAGFSAELDLAAGMKEAVEGYRARGWL